jgi:hypothetical protein
MRPLYATFFAAALFACAKNALDVSELTCDRNTTTTTKASS